VTVARSPGPISTWSLSAVNPAPSTPRHTTRRLDASVTRLTISKVRAAVVPGATAPNSSGPSASTCMVPGVVPSGWGQERSVIWADELACPSLTVKVTVRG
jgi:hypothetical protein